MWYINYRIFRLGVITLKKKTFNTFMATALTASLVLPVATVNAAAPSEQPIVVAEQGKAIPSGKVSLTITSFSNDQIYTSSGQLKISEALKPIFKSDNRAALTNAQATVNVENGKITSITALTLSKKGTSKKPIVFDGGQATISGNLTVAADYTKVQNVKVTKELIVSNRVKKGLTLNNVSVGDTIKFQPLRMKKISWLNVSLTNMPNVKINAQRNKLSLVSDKSLASIHVTDDVPQLKVESDIEKLVIDVKKDFSLLGDGIIQQVTVKKGKKVDLESYHQFKNVQVDDKKANVLVTIVDKTALNALVAASTYVAVSVTGHDVVSTERWTTQAEKTAFEAILNSAQTVANNPKSTQEQVNAAHTQLTSALATYKAAQKNGKKHTTGDKATITALINSIQYVTVSWNNGSGLSSSTAWTTQAEKDALVYAVSSAQSVVNNYYATQDQIVNALNNLESAITTYKNAQKYGLSSYTGDKSTLTSLINSVQYVDVSWNGYDIPYNTPWTTQADKDTLVNAVSSAQYVLYNYSASQYEITNAINNLNNAITNYKNAYKYGSNGNGYYGDKSSLGTLIYSVQYVEVSWSGNGNDVSYNAPWTTQAEKEALAYAVSSARAVWESYYATDYEITNAYNNLNYAISAYNSAIKYWHY